MLRRRSRFAVAGREREREEEEGHAGGRSETDCPRLKTRKRMTRKSQIRQIPRIDPWPVTIVIHAHEFSYCAR